MTKIEDLTMHTIRAQVWKAIETDAAAKKDLSRNVINVRALAKYLLSEYKINATLEAVISSIRRYRRQPLAKGEATRVYSLLKQAKIRTLTKMASLALKKNEEVHQKIGALLPSINSTGGEVLRVMEGA
ncbi:hypothetical protein HZB01_03880, partial [Candidatus Woesearchaeota archaeon]|nr:hypothetical protein [Candidatus Woesearchaeota archaeon]